MPIPTPGDWIVTFEFNRQPRRSRTPDHEPWTFEDLKDGFWIQEDYRLCRINQGTYWIPPSRIMLIEHADKLPERI